MNTLCFPTLVLLGNLTVRLPLLPSLLTHPTWIQLPSFEVNCIQELSVPKPSHALGSGVKYLIWGDNTTCVLNIFIFIELGNKPPDMTTFVALVNQGPPGGKARGLLASHSGLQPPGRRGRPASDFPGASIGKIPLSLGPSEAWEGGTGATHRNERRPREGPPLGGTPRTISCVGAWKSNGYLTVWS